MILKRKKNNRGLSAVVETMLLILLVFAVVGIVWIVVNNLVETQTNQASSCFNVGDKVTIDQQNTCYNESTNKLQLAIDVGDITNLQGVLVAVTESGQSTSYEITGNGATSGITRLDGNTTINVPAANSGITYLIPMPSEVTQFPDQVEISPVINGQTCQGPAPLTEIDSCALLPS